MLKRRVAAALLVSRGLVVQSLGFSRRLPVGRPEIAAEFLDRWGVDELVLLDLDASREGRHVSTELVARVAAASNVPLAVGGGIRELAEVDALLRAGADKVCVNHAARERPELITEIARRFGDQCVVAAVDVARVDGAHAVWCHVRRRALDVDLAAHLRALAALGAGEILVQATHEDGSGRGFDVALAQEASAAVGVPVLVLGGAGRASHFEEVLLQSGAACAVAGNYFHFTEHSVTTTKALAARRGLPVRVDTAARYADSAFDADGRLEKRADDALDAMLHVRIPKEII